MDDYDYWMDVYDYTWWAPVDWAYNTAMGAKHAAERWERGETAMNRFDIYDARMKNDIRTGYGTWSWWYDCPGYGSNTYDNGNGTQYNYKNLPTAFAQYPSCDVVTGYWVYGGTYTYEYSVANDGLISVDNQQWGSSSQWQKKTGLSHSSVIWNTKPWDGQQTTSMKAVKDQFRGWIVP